MNPYSNREDEDRRLREVQSRTPRLPSLDGQGLSAPSQGIPSRLSTLPSSETQAYLNYTINSDKGFTNDVAPIDDPVRQDRMEQSNLSEMLANRIGGEIPIADIDQSGYVPMGDITGGGFQSTIEGTTQSAVPGDAHYSEVDPSMKQFTSDPLLSPLMPEDAQIPYGDMGLSALPDSSMSRPDMYMPEAAQIPYGDVGIGAQVMPDMARNNLDLDPVNIEGEIENRLDIRQPEQDILSSGIGQVQSLDVPQYQEQQILGGAPGDQEVPKEVQKVMNKQDAEDLDYVMDVLNLSTADWRQIESDYFLSNPDASPEMTDSRDIMNWAKQEITKDMSSMERQFFEENLIMRDPRLNERQKMLKVWQSRTPQPILEQGFISTPITGLYKDINKVDPKTGSPMTAAEIKFIGERVSTYNSLFAGFENIGEILDRKSTPETMGELFYPGSETRTRLRNEIQAIYVESIGDNFYKRGANFTEIEKKMLEKFIVNLESNSPLKLMELKDMYEQTQQLFTRKMSLALKSYGYHTKDMPTEQEFNNWSIRVHSNPQTGVPEFSVKLQWQDPETGDLINGQSDISEFRRALDEAPDEEARQKLLDFVVPSKHAQIKE